MTQPEDHVFSSITDGSGRKVYRRRRKWQGASWAPPSMSSDVESGLWCKACRKRHGYMVLGLKYEKDSKGRWVMIWYCKTYGSVLGTNTLGTPPSSKVEPEDNDDSSS